MTTQDHQFDEFPLVPLTPEATGLNASVIARAQGAPNPRPVAQAEPRKGGSIRNVVFDFGGVLINWDPYGPLCSRYSDELIRQFRINDISGFDTANACTDSGHDISGAIAIMSRKGRLWGQMMGFYLHRFPQALMGEVPGARQLIDDLHAAGYKCWGLSNWSPQNFKDAWKSVGIFSLLDGFLVSGFIRDIKPHLSIFHTAAAKFGFDGSSAVFIDDKPSNAQAAREAGWKGITQRSPQQVRADLISLGVHLPSIRENE